MNFSDYIKHVRASGHYAFTTSDALAFLGISRNALSCGVYKLKKKNEIVINNKYLYSNILNYRNSPRTISFNF